MKEELIKLLGLDAKASDADIVKAVTALKSAVAASKPAAREQKISALMLATGMQRTDAEHTIDQQAREDAARAKAAKAAKK